MALIWGVFSKKIIALIGKINSLSTLFSIYKEYVDQAFTIVLLLIIMLFSILVNRFCFKCIDW